MAANVQMASGHMLRLAFDEMRGEAISRHRSKRQRREAHAAACAAAPGLTARMWFARWRRVLVRMRAEQRVMSELERKVVTLHSRLSERALPGTASPSHRRRASRPASWSDARRRQFHERLATRGGAGAAPTTARTRAARSSPGEARAAAAGAGQPRHTFAGASGQQTAATLCVPARRAADGVDGRSLHRRAGSNANVDVKVELGFRGWELAGFRSAENTRTRVAGSWRVLS